MAKIANTLIRYNWKRKQMRLPLTGKKSKHKTKRIGINPATAKITNEDNASDQDKDSAQAEREVD